MIWAGRGTGSPPVWTLARRRTDADLDYGRRPRRPGHPGPGRDLRRRHRRDHRARDLSGPDGPAPFLQACRRRPVAHVPVWFMRQAGRSLPEYRRARGSGSILAAIAEPELAAELTMQPVRRYGVDAAILFSDIVVPVHAVGFGIDVVQGRGPVVDRPFRSAADLDRLRPLEPEADLPHVLETVRAVTGELGAVPLIGFAGAPFTVASYLVEG